MGCGTDGAARRSAVAAGPVGYGSARRAGRTPYRALAALAAILGVLVSAGLAGPLFPFHPQPSQIAARVAQAPDVEAWLRESEARHPGIRPGLGKTIVWRDPALRTRTPLSLVYVHGFSASRRDISPVIEKVARTLRANAFFTRLAAHGLSTPEEFAAVTPQDWLDDAREAVAVGERIGERVVLVGLSTGALLAAMVAQEHPPGLAALVLLSPNFGLRDWRAKFLSGPLGPLIARLVIGRDHSFEPENARHGEYWTHRLPSRGIVALMDLVNHARDVHLTDINVPVLVIYTDKDGVVDTDLIVSRFAEIRDRRKRIVDLPSATRHELTGAALAPDTIGAVVQEIVDFLTVHVLSSPGPSPD